MPYIFLITLIVRFIYTYKKNKIVLLIDLLISIIAIALLFTGQTILIIIGYTFALAALGTYIYSHIISINDNKKRKKSKK